MNIQLVFTCGSPVGLLGLASFWCFVWGGGNLFRYVSPPKFNSEFTPENPGWKTILSYWEGNSSGAMSDFGGGKPLSEWRSDKLYPLGDLYYGIP